MLGRAENIMGKGGNSGDQHKILRFPTMLSIVIWVMVVKSRDRVVKSYLIERLFILVKYIYFSINYTFIFRYKCLNYLPHFNFFFRKIFLETLWGKGKCCNQQFLFLSPPPPHVPIAANQKGGCLQNTSKSHSYHL